jgi:hypothetical protein
MIVEDHITATADRVPQADLRPLFAAVLQRLINADGAAYTISELSRDFPSIFESWQDPRDFYPR